jgi:hypothetical protein
MPSTAIKRSVSSSESSSTIIWAHSRRMPGLPPYDYCCPPTRTPHNNVISMPPFTGTKETGQSTSNVAGRMVTVCRHGRPTHPSVWLVGCCSQSVEMGQREFCYAAGCGHVAAPGSRHTGLYGWTSLDVRRPVGPLEMP